MKFLVNPINYERKMNCSRGNANDLRNICLNSHVQYDGDNAYLFSRELLGFSSAMWVYYLSYCCVVLLHFDIL